MRYLVILGVSRSGKDTSARYLLDKYPDTRQVRFSHRVKRDVEQQYGLYSGCLEQDYWRNQVAPDEGGKTYLDLLVQRFHDMAGYYQVLKQTEIPAYLVKLRKLSLNPIFTDVRTLPELAIIQNTLRPGDSLTGLYLTGRGVPKTSDENIQVLAETLEVMSNSYTTVENTGSVEDLLYKVDEAWSRSALLPYL